MSVNFTYWSRKYRAVLPDVSGKRQFGHSDGPGELQDRCERDRIDADDAVNAVLSTRWRVETLHDARDVGKSGDMVTFCRCRAGWNRV